MIPILYDTNEVTFTSNGIGRLRDCISCIVTEERNGIYECDFEYPVTGANYDLIQIGRIVGVTHDDTGDIQPFDIVSFTKPINGVVTFHCTHISYRQSYMTVTGTNINSLSAAFTLLGGAKPSNPFTYQTDKTSTGFMAAADGIPRTVRQLLGGMEGSILDAYGGEYEWDRWTVILHSARGTDRDFSIRYGVNMLEYNDETDMSGVYSNCIPYWTDSENKVVANMTSADGTTPTGRGECVPLDLSDKFEEKPTKTDLQNEAKSYMQANNTYMMAQTINVSFVRLQDMGEFADYQNLLRCGLCDTVKVIFPDYQVEEQFKIVKTIWNVLDKRYNEMELGSLATSLSEALGISNTEKPYQVTKASPSLITSGYSGTVSDSELHYDNLTGLLYVNIKWSSTALAAGSTVRIGRIPTGYRPAMYTALSVYYVGSRQVEAVIIQSGDSDDGGKITVRNTGTSALTAGTTTYITGVAYVGGA